MSTGVDFNDLEEASTEEVYIRVMENASNLPELGVPDLKEVRDGTVDEDLKLKIEEFDLEGKILSSSIISGYDYSSGSNELVRKLMELVDPKVDWNKELIHYMYELQPSDDLTWARPNRRLLGCKILMPGTCLKPKLTANCYIDISGSLTDSQLTEIMSELRGISHIEGTDLNVVSWNTTIVDVFRNVNEVRDIHLKGSGGTNIRCVYKHIKISKPSVAIVFTDGYFDTDVKYSSPSIPLVWVITGKGNCDIKQGKVIKIEKSYSP
jgi:predicted metal-dependent peptidase